MTETFEFPIFSDLPHQDRYIQEIDWMCKQYFWPELPPVVWHYTSVKKLKCILETKSLLFTHVSQQDDPNEIVSSSILIRAILKAYLQANYQGRSRTLFETALAQINFNSEDSAWYSFSTSAAEDDAGQWHRYGDEDKGVSIGFEPNALLEFLGSPPDDRPKLFPIIYDSSKALKFFSLLTCLGEKNFYKDFQHIQDDNQAAGSFLSEWGQHINYLSIATKLPGWSAQKEWRFAKSLASNQPDEHALVQLGGKKRWRVARGSNSASNESALPIAQLTLGPQCSCSEDEIRNILTKYGLNGVNVKKSLLRKYAIE